VFQVKSSRKLFIHVPHLCIHSVHPVRSMSISTSWTLSNQQWASPPVQTLHKRIVSRAALRSAKHTHTHTHTHTNKEIKGVYQTL